MSGWICLHRSIIKWEWYDEPNTLRLFIHLLLKANFEDTRWRGIPIKRGQLITSYTSLSKDLGLTVSKIRTSLDKLKITGDIAVETSSQHTVITIKNYNLYQDYSTPDDTQIAGKSQANRNR